MKALPYLKVVSASLLSIVFGQTLLAQGEMGPHIKLKYLGDAYENYIYAAKLENGAYYEGGNDGLIVLSLWVFDESRGIVFKRADDNRFAAYNPEIDGPRLVINKLKFSDVSNDSLVVTAWAKASNPAAYPKDMKTGKTGNWLYVDGPAQGGDMVQVYVRAEISPTPVKGVSAMAQITVHGQRMLLYIKPERNEAAAVKMDLMAVPLEKPEYRKIEDDNIGGVALRFVRSEMANSRKNN